MRRGVEKLPLRQSIGVAPFLITLLVVGRGALAGLPECFTAAGNAIPTYVYQTNVPFNNGFGGMVNVNGVFTNTPFFNKKTSTYTWRITAYTLGPNYTAQQQQALQAQVTNNFAVAAVAPPSLGLDCHGFSLKSDTAGVYGANVPTILKDQGYTKVTATTTQKGDIVVYMANGQITHTAVVNAVNANTGAITSITSRWGAQGVYTGPINQVPASYGAPTQYWSAAAATVLTDPDVPADLSAFTGLPQISENPNDNTVANGFPGTTMALDSQSGSSWSYELDAPAEGIFLSPGATLTLFGQGITGASVSGTAATYPWDISTSTDPGTGDTTAIFTYEGDTSDLAGNIDGFNITSFDTGTGDMPFEETFNGTIGLTDGPAAIPEPSALLLIGIACGVLSGGRRVRC